MATIEYSRMDTKDNIYGTNIVTTSKWEARPRMVSLKLDLF